MPAWKNHFDFVWPLRCYYMVYKFIIFVKMKNDEISREILFRDLKICLRIHKYVDPIVCSISLRKLSHWIVQMPLINCNFLQFFAKTCGCLQTTLSTRLIRKLNGPENTVSVKRTYQASTIKFWFLKSMQQRGHSITMYVDIILPFFEYLCRRVLFLPLTWTKIGIFWPPTRPILST